MTTKYKKPSSYKIQNGCHNCIYHGEESNYEESLYFCAFKSPQRFSLEREVSAYGICDNYTEIDYEKLFVKVE